MLVSRRTLVGEFKRVKDVIAALKPPLDVAITKVTINHSSNYIGLQIFAASASTSDHTKRKKNQLLSGPSLPGIS
jgi:hypothetical protein